jgi:hypothetical protein
MTDIKGTLVGSLGLVITVASGWYVVRGPFFGYPIPPAEYLLAACGVFIVAMYLFAWGLDKNYRSYRTERPNIDEEQNQTLDMPFGPR